MPTSFALKSLAVAAAVALVSACSTSAPPPPPLVAGVAPPVPTKWGWGYSEKAKADMASTFGTDALPAPKYLWADAIPSDGATKIVVSLSDQMAWVYRGDRMIAATTVSSGKKDHESPVGQFPILGKEIFHKSNRYSAAPMPFMLRLNRWGVALHGGVVPGYPASHGCIRLPMAFAKKLYGYVKPGDNVFVEG